MVGGICACELGCWLVGWHKGGYVTVVAWVVGFWDGVRVVFGWFVGFGGCLLDMLAF